MTISRFIKASSLLLIVAGCAEITSFEAAGAVARESLFKRPDRWLAAQETMGEVDVGWIERIGDQKLVDLVLEAQKNNYDLKSTAANFERSLALAKQAGASLQPSVTTGGSATESDYFEGSSESTSTFNVGVEISWEADVWGRIRAGQRSAVASAQAAQADYIYAQHSLAASVARAYFVAVEQARIAKISQASLNATREIDRIVQSQFRNGAATAQDVALSRTDFEAAKSNLLASQNSARAAIRSLEISLGRYPAASLSVRSTFPRVPAFPKTGVPAELLERRPDIFAAEREVAAAFNELDQAKVANLPSLTLTGSIDGRSGNLSDVLDPANILWQLGGDVFAVLFDGGRNEGEIEQATAEQKLAIAAYGNAAIDAFLEVEKQIDATTTLGSRASSLRRSSIAAKEAYELASLSYRSGEIDLIDVLEIQQQAFSAEIDYIDVIQDKIDAWIALNLALGGSWANPSK